MDADLLTRDALAGTVDRFARRWHGYELHGVDNIPRDGGCLLVVYHGLVPLDAWYLLARLYREHGLFVRSLADRWLFRIPGLASLVEAGGAVSAAPDEALRMLKEGEPVLVSPGGTREALSGPRWHYQLLWGERTGFARVALEAHVPLLPVFSENVEELYRAPWSASPPIQWVYQRTGVPILPIVGLGPLPFPVKIRTWIGPPVHPRAGESAEELRGRVASALQSLIDTRQATSPRMLRALAQRLGLQTEVVQ